MSTQLQTAQATNPAVLVESINEVDKQIATAKHYPRDVKKFSEQVSSIVNMSVEIAQSCYYTIPREGKSIDGPSVRLAEIIVSCWTNICVATKVRKSKDGKTVCAEGAAWDLENNVRVTQEVERSIVTKQGRIYSENMQQVTQMAANAIAYRNVVFKVIPRCFVETFYKQAKGRVQQEMDNANPTEIKKKINRIISRIKNLGMSESVLLKIVNRPSLDAIKPSDYSNLYGIGTSIKEGIIPVTNCATPTHENDAIISTEEYQSMQEKIEHHEADVDALCDIFDVSDLAQLPKSKLAECLNLIEGQK